MRAAEEVFGRACAEAFPAALSQFGIGLSEKGSRICVAESSCCRVTVVLEWTTIAVLLRPLSSDRDEPYQETQVDIGWVRKPEDIPAEVSRQLEFLAKEHESVLKGDMPDWPTQGV